MKFIAFALLLVAAGASAEPQPEVDALQGRIYDLWVRDWLNRLYNYIIERNWDPLVIEELEIDYAIIPGSLEVRGTVKDVEVLGATQFSCDNLSYNFLLGRLDWDCVHRGVRASLGDAEIEAVYGDRRGEGTASGSIAIRDIRLKGNVLLKHDFSGEPWIYNINAELSVGRIESDVTIIAGERDYSERMNTLLNVRVPEMLVTHELAINTIVGEIIKLLVEYLRSRP